MLGTPFLFVNKRSISRKPNLDLIKKSNRLMVENTKKDITLPGILRGHTLNTNRKLMYSYLSGLLEGDGKIYVPKDIKGQPSISFALPTKDLPLFLLIQRDLKHGHIYKIKGKNAYQYIISNLEGIVLIIKKINGLMRTKKIWNLYELIEFLDIKYPGKYNIKKLPLDNSDIKDNAWLAGFTESYGSFYIRVSKNKNCNTYKVHCKYELAQSYDKNDYTFNIMKKISEFLLVDLKVKKGKLYWISTNSYKSNDILMEYFNKYSLYGSKYLDYLDWCKILKIVKDNKKNEKLEVIKNIKYNMNSSRTYLNWDHLNKFNL